MSEAGIASGCFTSGGPPSDGQPSDGQPSHGCTDSHTKGSVNVVGGSRLPTQV